MEFLLPELIGEENNILLPDEPTEIQKFYNGSTIFLTGATGFLGKLLLEKLLASCPGIQKIYALIRLKNHINIHHRIEDLTNLKIFDRLKTGDANLLEKVEFIRGDCSLPNLGLSLVDQEKLKTEIDVIFNCAAVTSCGANLKLAAKVNVMAVRDLLILAQKMKNLKALIHVSTAFANCHRNVLDENFVKPFISSKALLEFVDSMDPNVYHAKPIVLGKWPNNYIFTKSIAEDVIMNHALPVAIVRPSLISSTAQNPLQGWSDRSNSFAGLLVTAYLGLTKIIFAKKDNIAQIVPVDYVVNCLIASSWDVARSRALNENREILNDFEKTPIYNLGISQSNCFTWGEFLKRFCSYSRRIPSVYLLWYPWIFITDNKKLHAIFQLVFHYIPAYVIDIAALPFLRGTSYLSYYARVDELTESLSFYMLNSWTIKSDNVESLWMKLSQADKELFNFNLDLIDWEIYFYNFIRGIRVYILQDGLETLREATYVYRKRTALSVCIYAAIFGAIFWMTYLF